MARLLRHRQTKEAATDKPGLRDAESCSLLYPNSRVTPSPRLFVVQDFEGVAVENGDDLASEVYGKSIERR